MASILQDFGELDDRSESVLTFSTNSLLASSISDSRIGVLSCDNGDVHTTFDCDSDATSLCFDNTNNLILAGNASGTATVWDISAERPVRICEARNGADPITATHFYPYGELFTTGSKNGVVRVWDTRAKLPFQTHRSPGNSVTSLKFNPEGKWILSGHKDGLLKIWDMLSGKIVQEVKQHKASVSSITFHAQHRTVCTTDAAGTIHSWHVDEKACFTPLGAAVHGGNIAGGGGVRAALFSNSGDAFLCAFDTALLSLKWCDQEDDGTTTGGSFVPHSMIRNVEWTRAHDISMTSNGAVKVAASTPAISVWQADLSQFETLSASDIAACATAPGPRKAKTTSKRGGKQSRDKENHTNNVVVAVATDAVTDAAPSSDAVLKTHETQSNGSAATHHTNSLAAAPSSSTTTAVAFTVGGAVDAPAVSPAERNALNEMLEGHNVVQATLAHRISTLSNTSDAIRQRELRRAMATLTTVQNDDALITGALEAFKIAIGTATGTAVLAMCVGVLPLCGDVLKRSQRDTQVLITMSCIGSITRRASAAMSNLPNDGLAGRCRDHLKSLLTLLRSTDTLQCQMTSKVASKRAELLQQLSMFQ